MDSLLRWEEFLAALFILGPQLWVKAANSFIDSQGSVCVIHYKSGSDSVVYGPFKRSDLHYGDGTVYFYFKGRQEFSNFKIIDSCIIGGK